MKQLNQELLNSINDVSGNIDTYSRNYELALNTLIDKIENSSSICQIVDSEKSAQIYFNPKAVNYFGVTNEELNKTVAAIQNVNNGIYVDKNLKVEELAGYVLTLDEYKYLSSLKPRDKLSFFYTFWTKKEALVKALGKGLSYPINKIETMGLLSGKGILFPNENSELQQKWYCYELKVPKNYSGAIGTENKIDKIAYLEMCDLNILDNLNECRI